MLLNCDSGTDGLFYYVVDGERFAYKDNIFYLETTTFSAASPKVLIRLETGQTVGVENMGCSFIQGGDRTKRLYSFFSGELVNMF